MKLAVIGGGGVRTPAFVRALLLRAPGMFNEISLWEPGPERRETTGRLAVELAARLGQAGAVTLSADSEEAFTGADFVFSAIRVGGDRGRVIDEEVALARGLVGQETTGAGGAAMALRTIPVVLGYSRQLARCAPGAVLINFTNPAGLITQALSLHGEVPVVGVCDTPGGTVRRLAAFFGAEEPGTGPVGTEHHSASFDYGGLNHLGWVCSFRLDGEEKMAEILERYEELQRFDRSFAPFDPALVRRVGAVPTEYLFYYYDSWRYVDQVRRAGTSRGQDIVRLNEEMFAAIGRAFARGGVDEAWSEYSRLLGIRHDTYMRTDTEGESHQADARSERAARGAEPVDQAGIGGYEGVALRVIAGLRSQSPDRVIVNTRNGTSLPFLEADDVVELPAQVDATGIHPSAGCHLPPSARALVSQVKQYERALVDAAVQGDAGLAAVALALHPLVPGIRAARELISEYRDKHGKDLAYLNN
ncbi:MAG TPA: hypothetical protein VME46_25595 [Acidimicrobiales bacterium]|nr:hypothetical protein [Acidimicrobiales bacterium]